MTRRGIARAYTRLPPFLAALVVLGALSLASPREARAEDAWLGKDKAMHFGLSAAIATGAYGASALFLDPKWARATVAASFTLSLGIAKELYDLTGHGDPSWKDLTWDLLGTAVGVGVALAIDFAIRGTRDGKTEAPKAASARAFPGGFAVSPGGFALTF